MRLHSSKTNTAVQKALGSLAMNSQSLTNTVNLRSGIEGNVRSATTTFGDHRVVSFTVEGDLAALSAVDGFTITNACHLARSKGMPIVGFLQSTGARVSEGINASHGWGTAANAMVKCSGIVPIILVVTGPAVSGPALLLGIADITIMIDGSYSFVSGPAMVQSVTGVPISHEDLGGSSVHASKSGVASLLAEDRDDAIELINEFLGYLPASNQASPPIRATHDSTKRKTPALDEVVPQSATGSYDVRDVIAEIVDDGELLELNAAWAANIVTGLANIGGYPVGVVANQPQVLAGTLDIAASQKGARFVALCDAYNIALLTIVDTPGFQPGKDLEWRGMIRHGAQLAYAYARATVPRISLTVRKSYGGAYIVMDSKNMGNDLAFAWPSAEIAVMGAKGAVEILHRKATPQEREQLQQDYETRLLNPYRAAERGSIDAVIEPSETRAKICEALDLLITKRERLPRRRHDNTPL